MEMPVRPTLGIIPSAHNNMGVGLLTPLGVGWRVNNYHNRPLGKTYIEVGGQPPIYLPTCSNKMRNGGARWYVHSRTSSRSPTTILISRMCENVFFFQILPKKKARLERTAASRGNSGFDSSWITLLIKINRNKTWWFQCLPWLTEVLFNATMSF